MDPRDAVKYKSLDEAKPFGYKTTILYGVYGKRKTTTACSLVKEKGLLVSSDNSWQVLLKPIHSDLYNKITLVEYEGLSQLDYLDYDSYDTVIFDTFSKMVDNYLDLLLESAKWPSGASGGNRRDKLQSTVKELKDIEVPAPTDYRVVRDQFRPIVTRLIKAPINVIFTSHRNNPIPGLSKDTTLQPRISDGVYSIIAEAADVIGYIEGGRRGFTINVDNNSTSCHAKSRVEGIEGTMPLDDFITKMREESPSK